MPNGGLSDRERQELDRFFAPIANAISDYGRRHALKLQKYYHGCYTWDLVFLHPRGGVARIDVRKVDEGRVQVHKMWWRDDYRAQTRYIRRGYNEICDATPEAVARELASALREILSWEQPTEAHSGYRNWGRRSEEEFYAQAKAGLQYPLNVTGA